MKRLQKLLNNNGCNLAEDGIVGPHTLSSVEGYIRRRLDLPNTNYLVCGIRTDNKLTNTFDDYLFVNSGHFKRVMHCSTTPGRYWVRNLMNPKGVAILKPGYYKNSHKFTTSGEWKNLWLGAPYFQQISPVTVYRDSNKDNSIDTAVEDTGLFGINVHRGGFGSLIDRWSAGCVVIPDKEWYKAVSDFSQGQIVSLALVTI